MTDRRTHRFSAAVGVFLVVLAAGAAVLLGRELFERPALLAQVALLGTAGLCDILAVVDTGLTNRLAWYQWSGLGNVIFGPALAVGLVGTSIDVILLVVLVCGGLSLILSGVDMLVFHGRYFRREPLD
jgi:hypothetical protein